MTRNGEVHWSDPEFQEWEKSQLGRFREDEKDGYPYGLEKEGKVTHFRCWRRNPETGVEELPEGYSGPMFSFKNDGGSFMDLSNVDLTRVDEEDLKDAQW